MHWVLTFVTKTQWSDTSMRTSNEAFNRVDTSHLFGELRSSFVVPPKQSTELPFLAARHMGYNLFTLSKNDGLWTHHCETTTIMMIKLTWMSLGEMVPRWHKRSPLAEITTHIHSYRTAFKRTFHMNVPQTLLDKVHFFSKQTFSTKQLRPSTGTHFGGTSSDGVANPRNCSVTVIQVEASSTDKRHIWGKWPKQMIDFRCLRLLPSARGANSSRCGSPCSLRCPLPQIPQ